MYSFLNFNNSFILIGTTSNLRENEWILIKDLFYGLMLPSGNDSSVVLAENFGCLLYFDSVG